MRPFVCVMLASIALVGCGVRGQSQDANGVPVAAAALARLSTSAAAWELPRHPDRSPSWISPEVKGKQTQLLFVSDAGTDDVYMYELPTLKLMGTITGFAQPQGECADTKGDVWITDTTVQTIYEVSHEGRLENTLTDSTGYPDGCAWDSKSGSVAVMNLFDEDGGTGSVLVYPSASKPPTAYTNPRQYYYNFGGYDGSGNLFFDGRSENGSFILSELPAGADSAKTIKITGGKIYFPGMVQWATSSSDLLVGDQECGNAYAACVYQLTITGKRGTVAGSTKLETTGGGPVCDLVQGIEANGEILGSDNEFCGYSGSSTDLWPYPGGGEPTADNASTDSTPVGAALSSGK